MKLTIIERVVQNGVFKIDKRLETIKRVLRGEFLYYASVPDSQQYIVIEADSMELALQRADKFGYDVEVVHESEWGFPPGWILRETL